MALLDLGVKLRHALVIERHLSADEDVQYNAETPDINLGASILLSLEQFWGGKVQTSTERL